MVDGSICRWVGRFSGGGSKSDVVLIVGVIDGCAATLVGVCCRDALRGGYFGASVVGFLASVLVLRGTGIQNQHMSWFASSRRLDFVD